MLEKLEQLADFLMTVPPEKFDFSSYLSGMEQLTLTGQETATRLREECGTAGCAIGWAVALWSDEWYSDCGFPHTKEPHGSTLEDAAVFFGISEVESDELFIPYTNSDDYLSPKQVAHRILEFIKEKRNEPDPIASD